MFSSLKLPLATAEATRRQHLPSTFTEPLHVSDGRQQELKEFLADFYKTIYHKRNELAQLLEENATLSGQYQTLVVEQRAVAHEDFWQRYFWKCDAHRILTEWQAKDHERAAARSEYIAGGLARVQKLIHHETTTSAEAENEETTSSTSPTHDDAVDDFLETKKCKTDGVDDFLDSGPVGGEEPLVFWNKEDVQKEPSRPPQSKKRENRKPPKRVSFAEPEKGSVNDDSTNVVPSTDEMRKETATNRAQAVISEEPVNVVDESSKQADKTTVAAIKTPSIPIDDSKRDVDRSVAVGGNSLSDIDVSNDENRDKPILTPSEKNKGEKGTKPRTAVAGTPESVEKPINSESETVKQKELVVTETSDKSLDDSEQSPDKSTKNMPKRESSVKVSPTRLGGSDVNKAASSVKKTTSKTFAKVDGGRDGKVSPVSKSDEPQVKPVNPEEAQHAKVAMPIVSQSEESKITQTKPSTMSSTIGGKVGASSVESSQRRSSPVKSLETNKRDDSSTATSKMRKTKGTKVSEMKSRFESASTIAKKSNRTMGSSTRKDPVARSRQAAPVLRSWNTDRASKGSTRTSMSDTNDPATPSTTSIKPVEARSDSHKIDPATKKQSTGTRRRPVAMLRAWTKSRRSKNGNSIAESDTAIDDVSRDKKPLEPAKNPRSKLLDAPPEKVHIENVDEAKDAIKASKDKIEPLETSTNKLKWTIVTCAVLAMITIGIFLPSSAFVDGLCAPAFPSYKLTSSDTNVYLEAPWWAPLPYKTRLFPVVCGKDRLRTVVEWVPFDKKKNADHHRLVIRSKEGEIIHRDKKKLTSASLYSRKIVTVDQHGDTQEIPAPWMLAIE